MTGLPRPLDTVSPCGGRHLAGRDAPRPFPFPSPD